MDCSTVNYLGNETTIVNNTDRGKGEGCNVIKQVRMEIYRHRIRECESCRLVQMQKGTEQECRPPRKGKQTDITDPSRRRGP